MGMQCLIKWLWGQLEGMKWILMPILVVLEQIGDCWILTNEVCKVTLFLDSYEPVKEVMVVRCSTVWTSPDTGHEYLLVGDQMLWFGNQMKHSLINPNQICEYGLPVYDDPFSNSHFGIDGNKAFIPFNTMGTIVYFETCVPIDWEMRNLPIIMLTGEEWDPANVRLGNG